MRVLLVDDDPEIVSWVTRCLLRWGHQVAGFTRSVEAQKELLTNSYDLLITDIYMPDIDGLELIRKIRPLQKDLRILGISGGGRGFNSDYALHCAHLMGANAMLCKPFDVDDLLEAVEALAAQAKQAP